MNGIGVMSSRTLPTNTEANIGLEASSFTRILPEICKQAHIFCNQMYPGVVPLIHHLESSSGLTRPPYLGGARGVSSSMALSLDLVNSTHYDVNDGSVGFFVSTESMPGSAVNWNFVLPNICIKYQGVTYNGLAIKLGHGSSILFDGRIIRHGTSRHYSTNSANHTVGWFWGLNSRTFVNDYI